MANATIIYERTITPEEGDPYVVAVDMTAWPPTSWLVQLDPPLRRYNPEDGTLNGEYDFVVVTCQDATPRASYVFPSNAEGGFVDPTMRPMRTRDYGTPAAVLAQIGYDVTP